MRILNKIALVTGAADGIGLAIVERLLAKGAGGIAFVDKNANRGKQVELDLKTKYGEMKVYFIDCDVSDPANIEAAYKETKKQFGWLDIVCNNAGIMDEYNWEKMIDVNLTATIKSTYEAVRYMGTQHGESGGVIVNVASIMGLLPYSYLPVYSATKHAVVGFTRSVSSEPDIVENCIRISAICPVRVKTSLEIDLQDRCRYSEEIREDKRNLISVPPSQIADAVIEIIERRAYSGCVVTVVPDAPLTVIAPPNIDLK